MRPKTFRIRALLTFFTAAIAIALGAQAQSGGSANIAATDVYIAGSSLALEDVTATTGVNIPVQIQTSFGGLKNEQAPKVPELSAVGDLTGPGLSSPITLTTDPGHSFTIPGLPAEGTYLLQNVRLMRGSTFVQSAVPSSAAITVADILKTKVSVRQLTAAELRARGITIDDRNFDVYEYTLSFFVGTQEVLVPFPVMVDKRTHEIIPINKEQNYSLPGFKNVQSPPRWGPPTVSPMELGEDEELPGPPPEDNGGAAPPPAPRIPAAIVIPNTLGVLHQFFAVALTVTNNAPTGSSITLDSITATLKNPPELRVADVKPAVSFGRPVPLVDPNTGTTILIAQAKAEADWTLEALKTGTHTFSIEVNATYHASSTSPAIALRGSVSQQLVVHDPRFNITFSHPDTVRAGLTYSTFTFVTNTTPSIQTIRLRTGDELPACSSTGDASICRLDNDIESVPLCSGNASVDLCRPADDLKSQELTLKPGATRTVVYKLRSNLTGNVFATAGSVDSDVIHAAVQLHMGVSTSGIPLSPATLVMPYYAQYLDEPFVTDELQLLGLGYSLATAPVNQTTASFPRVITTDVFHRAVDIARAGQRIFIGEDKRDSFANLTLDLLGNGNGNKLSEWDELRRREYSGRIAGASLARQIEAASLKTAGDFDGFLARFGQATAWRAPYLVAVTHGAAVAGNTRPYAISLRGVTTNSKMDLPNELATEESLGTRDVAFGDLSKLTSGDNLQTGEMATAGLWSENYELTVTPAAGSSFVLDVLYPSTAAARIRHAIVNIPNASGKALKGVLDPNSGIVTLTEDGGSASYSGNATEISPAPLAIIAAHQDMHLDANGHKVAVLFNRPVDDATDYKPLFAGKVVFNQGTISYNGPRGVDAAALQDDARTIYLTFDHALSKNATYSMQVQPIRDPLSGTTSTFADVVPVLENDRPAGIIYGRVLRGDNTPVPGAQVVLTSGGTIQYDTSSAAKADFLFEYVLRDLTAKVTGAYNLRAVDGDGKAVFIDGAIRLTGVVETVNLVYLGRGSAEGRVTYDNGAVVPNARVVVGSTLFDQFRSTTTAADGTFRVTDLPVGPLTFSATDTLGNTTFGASEIRSAGEVVHQDLSIYRTPFPGTATVRGVVVRSDTSAPVPNAHVGVYTQGYGLTDAYTDANGHFEFDKVTTGIVTVLASEWSVSRKAIGIDFDLAPDQVKDLTLTLEVNPDQPLANLEGDVEEEDPLNPGTYKKVPGALVQIKGAQVVTCDANGHFTYSALPLTFGGADIKAYNPASKRVGLTSVPTLDPATNAYVRIPIRVSDAFGTGNIQVRVLNAAGQPVSNMRVFEPGYPITPLRPLGDGKYQLDNVRVGSSINVWAVTTGDPTDPTTSRYTYGDQFTSGTGSVAFNGQTTLSVLRMPGQGKLRVRLLTDIVSIGDVNLQYQLWDDAEQGLQTTTRTASTKDPATGQASYAIFDKVPVGGSNVYAALAGFGYDSKGVNLVYDGQIVDIDLQAKKLASVAGAIYNIDGITPMPGVPVRMTDGAQTQGPLPSALDGSFKFSNVAPARGFTVTAESNVGGIYRVGIAGGVTPSNGGPVNNISVTMKQQGSVEGFVVYSGYKVFDPNDPSKNVVDDTPNDLSDNARVPLAQFVLREVSYPYRSFGKDSAPLSADISGHFQINNVFAGPVRLDAWSQQNQDLRGSGNATVVQEGSTVSIYAAIGTQGFGPLAVTVVDPNNHNQPVENAEVTLAIPTFGPPIIYDFGTTDANGTVRFDQVPARNGYEIDAFSKLVGKSGKVSNINVLPFSGASVLVELQFSGSVNGTLTDPEANNAGVPGIPVILATNGYQQQTSTTATGTYFLGGIHEGTFLLDALQETTRRRAHAQGAVSAADPNPTVNMELEHTSPLYVKVLYPNDDGSPSNVEVPTSDIHVKQRCRPVIGGEICEYARDLQGSGLVFTSLFASDGYSVSVHEVGGDQRSAGGDGSFPVGATATNPFKVTLPAYGTVEVTVRQPDAGGVMRAATGARVNVRGVVVTTDTNGLAVAHGIPLGDLSVGAVSFDGIFSAYSTTVHLGSQSVPLQVSLDLGAYAGISGYVNAELGGPSFNTRVVANFAGRQAMTFTDATGFYKFQGISVANGQTTPVSLIYFGPDDKTVGASQSTTLTVADASQIRPLVTVTLDATPPEVISISPQDNYSNVSPDSNVVVVFSEPIALNSINRSTFQLFPTDGSPAVNTTLVRDIDAVTHTCTITAVVPPSSDPGQRFPLKSNMLYRVLLTGGLTDEQGHPLAQRGFSFITADYIAPKVVSLEPQTNVPLSASTTFNVRFNKPLASQLFNASHNIVAPLEMHLYKLSGPNGTVVTDLAGSAYGDPTNTTLSFAPSAQLEEKTSYRLAILGVRDTIGNVADAITYDYVSFDKTPPYVTFDAPVPPGTPVISGVRYTLKAVIRDGSATADPATDTGRVDFFRIDGTAKTLLTSLTKAPFEYSFVAPTVTQTGTTLTFHVEASDTSLNNATPQEISFDVAPNLPPQDVKLTLTTPDPIYPNTKVSVKPSLTDEGVLVTLQAQLTGTKSDGTAYTSAGATGQATRAKTTDPWTFTPASFDFVLPANLLDGSTASITMTAADGVNAPVNAAPATFTVAADTNSPTVTSLTVSPASPYHLNDKYTITAIVKDAETGVSDVTFTYDGKTTPVTSGTLLADGSYRFVTPQITVPAKNDDTKIAIVATAKDFRGNRATAGAEVTYIGLHDATVPRGAWVSPIANAAWPSDQTSFTTTLRVYAKDDQAITSVTFTIPGVASPVTATAAGNDLYTAQATFATPAPGSDFSVTAAINDADPSHTQTITIPIALVKVDTVLGPNFTQAITSPTDPLLNKSVLLQGPNVHLVMHVPFTFKNLIAVDGASIETLPTTTSTERKLDLTVSDTFYIDSTSIVDVAGKGYVGGWGVNQDSSGTKNEDARGRTAGNTVTGGATATAAASHGGAGANNGGATNATYDSIITPRALGAGGGGNTTCCNAGGQGGGAGSILGGSNNSDLAHIIVAGTVRADGVTGSVSAGGGGSVRIGGKLVSLGRNARITANGGDEGAVNNSARGAGGGRVSVTASDELDLDDTLPQIQARGGRNLAGDGKTQLDGGAGTVYLRRPGQTLGELVINSYDERYTGTSTNHQTRPTIVGYTGSGNSTSLTASTLTDSSRTFVSDAIGEELMLGGDTTKSYTITAVSADGHTLTTDAADGSLLNAPNVNSGVVAYAGLLQFDVVRVSDRALARVDDSININGAFDDATKAAVTAPAVILLPNDVPVVTSFTTTPADGSNVIRGSNMSANYSVTSAAGIGSVSLALSPVAAPFVDGYSDYPTPATKSRTLALPSDAALGSATLTLTATDRAGRQTVAPAAHYTIVENAAPSITKFDVTPSSLQMYAGHSITVDAGASDDVAVTAISLATTPSLTIVSGTPATNGSSMTRSFTVTVPPATPSNTSVQLMLSADDGLAGHTTPQQKSVSIIKDPNAPSMSVSSPTNQDAPYLVGSNVTIPVRAVITDAEVGVSSVYVTLDGVRYDMSADPSATNGWKADIPVPWVDGSDTVTKPVIVYATDYDNNLATSATISVKLKPNLNPEGPVVSWLCPSSGALFPAGYTARLRVNVVAGKPDNAVTGVSFYVGSSPTAIPATLVNGTNWYEANVPMPSGSDGDQVALRVTANSFSQISNSLQTTITLVTGGRTISTNTTILSSDTSYDNQTVIVTAGANNAATTVTIDGVHTFARLLVLDNATVTHSVVNGLGVGALNVTTTGGSYISCLANIDVSGRGYQDSQNGTGRTYNNTFTGGATGGSGASHGGAGGQRYGGDHITAVYDSIYDPSAPGSAGPGCNAVCNQGGGVIRLKVNTLTIDGKLYANGFSNNANGGGGAGGAIRIEATGAFAGSGEIHADGAAGQWNGYDGYRGSGGGGRVAVYYRSSTFTGTKITASGGQSTPTQYTWENGAAGTVYLQQTDSTGAKSSEELIVDNSSRYSPVGTAFTALPGSGSVTGVNGAVVTLSAAVPEFIIGSQVEFLDGTGSILSSYPVTARTASTITVKLGANESAANAPNGSAYRTAWKFDKITVRNNGWLDVPQLRMPLLTTDSVSYAKTDTLLATDFVLHGILEVNKTLTASTLTVENGSILTHTIAPAGTAPNQLNVNITGAMTVDATSSIDVTSRGYQDSVNGAGRTWNNTTSGGATGGTGASHGGIGGQRYGTDVVPAAYGSVIDPAEPGGSGAGCNAVCSQGGGVVRINAGSLQLNGKINANGIGNSANGGAGAGGSVRIVAGAFTGTGEIHANGGDGVWNGYDGYRGSGGGGRIAVWYQSTTFDKTKITANGGTNQYTWENGGAGTIYLRQTDPSLGSYTDELIVDNAGRNSPTGTPLPTVGSGTVTNVNGAVVTLSNPVGEFVAGSTIEFVNADGSIRSSYIITARTATTVTVALASGETAANAATGTPYRGMWKFDKITLRNNGFLDVSQLRFPLLTTDPSSYARVDTLNATDFTLHGNLEVNTALNATSLTIENNSLLTHTTTSAGAVRQLNINITGAMTVDATSTIDVTSRGYQDSVNGAGRTWNNTTSGGATGGTGASHGGIGGQRYGTDVVPVAYGSVIDPAEPGGSGAGCNAVCSQGGGIVRINAGSLQLNGKINANGTGNNQNGGAGAGGSVRIVAGAFTGSGEIHANGGDGVWNGYDGYRGSGGGGRIAVWYQSTTFDKTKITANGGTNQYTWENGGAGTIYLRQTDPSLGSYTDELIVDNAGRNSPSATPLPTVGSGTVTNVNGAVVTLSNPVGEFVAGSTIEFLNADGSIRSSYIITARTATTVTVALGSSETAADAVSGTPYRGVWSFTQITMRGGGWVSAEALKVPTITAAAGTTVTTTRINQGDLTINGGGTVVSGPVTSSGNVTISGARLDANGTVKANALNVVSSGILSHSAQSSPTTNLVSVDAASVVVDATSSIDVTGRGYQDSANGVGRTYPYTFTGGATGGAGASHGGVGAPKYGGDVTPATYGSLFDPDTPGGAGAGCNGVCDQGGGVVRIKANTFQLDGKILAYGIGNNSNGGAGAGGSVRIDAGTFSGAGEVHADGGVGQWNGYDGYRGSGGGGRVAVYYTTMTVNRSKVTAFGGYNTDNPRTGAPGTIYFKQAAAPYGELVVANNGKSTSMQTHLISVGYRTADSVGTSFVKNNGATMPDKLAGVRMIVNWDKNVSWPIVSNTADTLNVDVSANALTATVGQPFRGMYRFDHVTLRNANLALEDLLVTTDPLDSVSSTLIGSNAAPPAIDTTKITLPTTPTGSSLVAAANAVTDSDTPITVTIRNATSGATQTLTVAADGSFTAGVIGNAGDQIQIKAKDSNVYPLETRYVTVGTLPVSTPAATQINATAWTSDAQFVPRLLAAEGKWMAVASRPTSNGMSDKVVVLDMTDPARPQLSRVVSTGSTIYGIAISNGYLMVANNRFSTFNLNDPNSTQVFAADQSGIDYSLAVSGSYAFTGEANANNDARVNVYDVSNPAAPRFLSQQTASIGNNALGGMITYGTDYLIGFSWWGGNRDLVIFDRRNPNAMTKVGELQIANFAPFKGKVIGTKLYLVGDPYTQMVVVDLTNPAAPVVAATLNIPAPADGVDIVGSDAFIAAQTSGLVTSTIDTANLKVTGTLPTGGSAWDVIVQSGYAYVANEIGVALVQVNAAPVIRTDRISLTPSGSTAVVAGATSAVTGGSPTITLVDTNTNASVTNLPVNADGTFNASLPASPGDTITITATNGKTNGPVTLGQVPFNTATNVLPIVNPAGDTNWRARMVRVEGNNLALASFPADSNNDTLGNSPQIQLYDISNPAAPVLKRTVAGSPRMINMQIVNGWLYMAGTRFGTLDLSSPTSTPTFAADQSGNDYGLVISGGYAFTSQVDSNNDGRLNIYDVSNPAAPRFLSQSAGIVGNHWHSDLLAYGSDYLIGLSTSNDGVDVMVLDRRNVNNVVKVAQLSIPNMTAFRGRIVGTKLYVGGADTGVAIVDLTNPLAPSVVTSVTNTPFVHGVDLSGSTLAAAYAGDGVAFYDVSNNTLNKLGTVPTGGVAWDVAYGRGELYVAADTALVVLANVTAPPAIDTRLISVSGSSATLAGVTGTASAVSGTAPFTTELKDLTSGATSSVTIAADGSFTASMPASPGDTLTLKVTDANNRVAGPTVIGRMPFGTAVTTFPVSNPANDTNWRARMVRVEGNNLALASFPADSNNDTLGNSPQIQLYDISNPSAPVLKRTVAGSPRMINMQIVNGWLYMAGTRFGTLDLSSPTSTPVFAADQSGNDYGLVISGGYAFTSQVDSNNDGRLNIYDVSNPAAPRFLSQSPGIVGNHWHSDLLAYGSDYLIGLSTSNDGVDVMVLDRRNVNNVVKVAQLSIPNMTAFRGRIVGTKLYVGGADNGVAIVDLTNPLAPSVVTSVTNTPFVHGVDLAGSTLAAAYASNGVAFFDVSNNTLNPIGTQPTGGVAWDVAFGGANLYVANDQGLVVIQNVVAPPQIDTRLISVSASSSSMATATGTAAAVTGQAPFTAELKDTNSGASISVNIAANGSFTGSIPASPGDTLTLKVTDAGNRVAGPTVIGRMPFGSNVTVLPIVNPAGDGNWRARIVRVEGNNLAVAAFPADSNNDTLGNSPQIALYDISNPSAPVFKRNVTGSPRMLNMQIVNGWLYMAGTRFGTLDLSSATSTPTFAADQSGNEYGLVVSGGYAFTSQVDSNNDGRLNIYDVTNPAAPRFLSQSPGIVGNHWHSDLLAYGSDYLIGLSTSNDGIDVMVLDRRNVNNVVKVAQLSIPNMTAFRGRIAGTKLYVGGADTGVAIVDLTNPTAPTLVTSLTNTPFVHGVDLAGSTLAAAYASNGVAFFDVSNNTLNPIGTQPTGGVAWDVAFGGANLYVANDEGLVVIQNVIAPPQIDTRQISVMTNGTNAIVHGNAGAVTGLGALTAEVKDASTGASIGVNVNSDGSFDATLPASSGDTITVKATDGNGRTAGPIVVGVVPFGTAMTTVPVIAPDANWRARMVRTEGNRLLLGPFPGDGMAASGNLVQYDISNPAAPVFGRVIPGFSYVLDLQIVNGWGYVAGNRFGTIDLTNPSSTVNLAADQSGNEYGLAVSGGYAFTAQVDSNNDGRINVYDVADPGSPRFVVQTGSLTSGGHYFSDLIPYGTNYLVGILRTDTAAADVAIIDRRDVLHLTNIATVSLGSVSGFRGRIVGTKLYVGGFAGGSAILDLTNIAAPSIVASSPGTLIARGLDLAGSTMALANGADGVSFYDVSANTLRSIGGQPTGGVAWDASFDGGNLYVANDQGFVVIRNIGTPADIRQTLITITPGTSSATISGAAHAIGAAGSATVAVTDNATGASIGGVAVNADGSFTTSITASSGDKLTLAVTDGANRVATRSLGQVPFFTVTNEFRGTRDNDAMFVRRILTDGTHTAVMSMRTEVSYPGPSSSSWLYTTGASALTFLTAGSGVIQDATMQGNYVFTASDRLTSFDITQAAPTLNVASNDSCGRDIGIAVSGNYAYTGQVDCNNDGRINIWNITNPAAPTLATTSNSLAGSGGVSWHVLLAYGTQYILGITPDTGVRDLYVFDISNPTSPVKIGSLDIPNFTPDAAVVDGSTLYLANFSGSIAIVDLTTPATPVLKSTIATPGLSRAVSVVAPNEIAVADSSMGVTFINVADKAHPVIEGTQQVNGQVHDIKAVGKTLYLASETRFQVVQRP